MQIANFGESALNSPKSFRRNGQADESAAAIYNLHFSIFNVTQAVSPANSVTFE